MKKPFFFYFLLGLIYLILFSFTACSSKTGNKIPTIGVAIYSYDDPFMQNIRSSIEANAAGKINLEIVNSQNSQPMQNDQVDAFLSRKVDAMAICLVEQAAAASIIEKAKARNVSVVFFTREPSPEDMVSWDKVYYVSNKDEESGSMQGEIAFDYWMSHPSTDRNGDGILQYIMLKGERDNKYTELRSEFSIRYLTDRGIKVECLAEYYANWDQSIATEVMYTLSAAYDRVVEMIFCNNDYMALGAIEALKTFGYFQDGKFIPVLGIDGDPSALHALGKNTLLGTVLNDADNLGKAVFDIAYALAAGANPADSGWTITDGKYIWAPCRKIVLDPFPAPSFTRSSRLDYSMIGEQFLTIESLRIRSDASIDPSNIIKTIPIGTIVEIVDIGEVEVIDDITAPWALVKTQDGVIGWCFGGYLIN